MPKTLEEARELDRRFNGAQNDYDERLTVKYFINKHHYIPVVLDIEHKWLVVANAVIIECN